MAVIENKRIMKCLLLMVVSLLLVLNFSIGVSASNNYDRQEADAYITISERLSVKGGSKSELFLPDEYYQKIDDNIAKAIEVRDAEVARIQSLNNTQQSNYTTVVGGVDLRTNWRSICWSKKHKNIFTKCNLH